MQGPAFRLRPFTKADLAPAYQLDQVCFPRAIAYTESELRYFVLNPSAYALVAESTPDLGMRGFLVATHATRRKESVATIITIDVAPHARRSGVATLLMDATEAHYRELGCTALTLEVAVDNLAARAFYTQRGFVATGLQRGYYNGVLDAFTMELSI